MVTVNDSLSMNKFSTEISCDCFPYERDVAIILENNIHVMNLDLIQIRLSQKMEGQRRPIFF